MYTSIMFTYLFMHDEGNKTKDLYNQKETTITKYITYSTYLLHNNLQFV
jgi:hypothetical protein